MNIVMHLREALSDIADIRALLDRNQSFRGFRSVAIGISALFVLTGALVQLQYDVVRNPSAYLDIWLFVALGSLIVTVVEMIVRGRVSNDLGVWKMHGKVVMSLAPSFLVGALVTAVLVLESRHSMVTLSRKNIWLLPGVWAMIYSLGLFSCCNLLHRATRFAAIYFLLSGGLYLLFNWNVREVEAWHMIAIFGMGQFLLAGILFWKVERFNG